MSKEDAIVDNYKYAWPSSSAPELPLSDFLNKYKPSMVQNDGTKPWIWVKGKDAPQSGIEATDAAVAALEEASVVLKKATTDVENIKNDASIPMRSNKKTGAKSKKEVREERQAEATANFKSIAIKYCYVHGKWLMFVPADKVDMVWKGIANGLVSGELSKTCAFLAKVATSPETPNPNAQHLVCVYIPDVYDKDAVTEVMKVLLRHHGVNLSGVKSDLYTALGIDSKHPAGLQSTTWKNSALMGDAEIKALRDEFFNSKPAPTNPVESADPVKAEDSAVSVPSTEAIKKEEDEVDSKPKDKPKTKVKRKKQNDDPFASDENEENEKPASIKKAPPAKRAKKEEPED